MLETVSALKAPARQRLDIVRECEDLRGQFPANVELKFVYWAHGVYEEDELKNSDPIDSLTPHLLNADLVAFEVAEFKSGNADEAPHLDNQLFLLNELIAGKRMARTVEELLNGEDPYKTLLEAIQIRNNLITAGSLKDPYFCAVDTYANPIPRTKLPANHTAAQSTLEVAEWIAKREVVTIRQLHGHAQKLAQDGQQHQMAIIYGAAHNLLSVATRELGAPTSRVFVSRPSPSGFDCLKQLVRFEADPFRREQEIAATDAVTLDGINSWRVCQEFSRLSNPDDLMFSIVWLYYRAMKNTLTPRQMRTFEASDLMIKPYKNSDLREPNWWQKRKLRLSIQRLVDLADEVQ